jgi:glycosyltransferase involved in cell wall biosynthesis
VPERDHEKLAAALLDAVKDPDFLSRIARNGAAIVRENFDLNSQARRLEDIYLRLIQR